MFDEGVVKLDIISYFSIHSHNERPISTNRNSGVSSSYNNGEGILNSNGVMPPILPPEFPPELDIPSSGNCD